MRIYTLLSLVFFFLVSSFSFAQELNLPRKSPKAGIFHTIGYTEVAIQYGSPAVQGREIWGGLAPYGELWRAGADEATIMEFSMDVELEGQPLAAGKYAFFLIPQKEGKWTAVFNKTWDQWGAYNYDPGQDALRVEVDAQFSKQANQEHLQYEIIGQNVENGYILLSWEKLRLYLRVKVNTMQKAVLEITTALAAAPEAQKWRINAQAADFLLWVGQPGPALQYIEESIRLFKVGMIYPLDGDGVREFARGLEEIFVVEEKRGFLELLGQSPHPGGPGRLCQRPGCRRKR